MIINKDEKRLLLSIKIIPLVLFIFFAIVGAIVALYINKANFDSEINKVKDIYLKNEKEILKQEILKIHNNIINEKRLVEDKLKHNIKEKVYEAYAVINNIYKQNQTKSKKEIFKLITDALRDVRFNDKRGYFFMYKMDGTTLLLPTRVDLEGTNLIDLKDAKGAYTIRNLRDLSKKNDESFYTWWWYKPNENRFQSKKIGFAKYFEPLDCFVGTGEYVKDFEETIKSSITKRLSTYKHGKNSYIFVFDKNGIVLSHENQNAIGKKLSNLKSEHKKDVTHELIKIANNGGGFLTYQIKKEDQVEAIKKISYVIKYENWDWTIGSGFDTKDLNKLIEDKKNELHIQNKDDINKILIISLVIIVLIIFLSLTLSYAIEQRFENYKKKVHQKDKLIFQQSKMVAMGEMLENIAHQWRQPLSIISTTSSGIKLQREFGMLCDEDLNKSLDNISTSANYLSQTVDDFRDFYKDDKMKQSFNVSDSINKAIKLVHSKFKKQKIKIIIQKSDIKFHGFENELIQVFMNMLNNARDVLEELEDDTKLILIEVKKDDENIAITFQDNANGIDKKIISKVFDHKFTTKEKCDGTGLGLYMSKLIAQKVGGTIEVENKKFEYEEKEYTGALFTIILPIY